MLAVLGLDAVVPLQRRRHVAAPRGHPAEVVADLGRRERLAVPRVELLGATEVGLGGAQGAAVDLQDAAVAQAAAPPTAGRRRGGTPTTAAGSPPARRPGVRAAAGSAPAGPASAPARRRPAPGRRARPRPAPRRSCPAASAPTTSDIRASPARSVSPLSDASATARRRCATAASASPSSIAASPSARSATERVSRSSAASASPASRCAARASAVARRMASSACSNSVWSRSPRQASRKPALARHPRDRRGCWHERTARALGPPPIALAGDKERQFLLRPGQILVGPGDAPDVAKVLTGWKPQERRTFGVTTFVKEPSTPGRGGEGGPGGDHARPPADGQAPAGPGARRAQPRARGRERDHADRRAARAGRARLVASASPSRRRRCPTGPPAPATARASGSPCSTPACSPTRGWPPSRPRRTPPTSGTSTTTSTPTPSPATARSSRG